MPSFLFGVFRNDVTVSTVNTVPHCDIIPESIFSDTTSMLGPIDTIPFESYGFAVLYKIYYSNLLNGTLDSNH